MAEKSSTMPTWAWIVGAVLVAGIIFMGYRITQTDQRLVTAQSALKSAMDEANQAKQHTAKLVKQATISKLELEKANAGSKELQAKLDRASTEIDRVKSEFEQASAKGNELQNKLDQTALEIKQLRGKLEIANSERSELQNRVNQTTSQMKRMTGDLEAAGAKGNELQNSLNQAMSEIGGLKRELEAARSASGAAQSQPQAQ